ncbi:AAA family ATPase [Streptomyces sp. DSM 41524]|uniref:AAA family ATPase n=1 Tax=Streptomyces asiaticus subsp. ignotus TaxID=3098222 RepID=A0ABU7Q333_9ACTN|nr:AAA family ATPase [Streptomyces sp. DSM 41524]
MDIQAIVKHFGFSEHPFITTPDPRFLYFSSQVREALAKCEFMARDRIGPIYMYGPIGSGKTSLVRRLHEKLSQDDRYNVKLLILPNAKSSNALLRLILESFDVKTERSYTASLANFEAFLVEQYKGGKIPVLLVDEAQYMTREHLKLVHYLLNFETNTTKLLQIVLVGQEELGTKIIGYRELASRMFPIAMNAMSLEDLRDMVQFRLTVAGRRDPLFESGNAEEAYRILYTYTKGLPRDAIKVCFELLIELASQGQQYATGRQVEEIAKAQNLRI